MYKGLQKKCDLAFLKVATYLLINYIVHIRTAKIKGNLLLHVNVYMNLFVLQQTCVYIFIRPKNKSKKNEKSLLTQIMFLTAVHIKKQ